MIKKLLELFQKPKKRDTKKKLSETKTLEQKVKGISIRGRFAFGVKCIEQYVYENNLQNSNLEKLISTLKKFTLSNKLEEWDDEIREISPYFILDPHPNNNASDYKSINENKFIELKSYYASLDTNFIKLLEEVTFIGIGNLYGGTGLYSEITFHSTMKIIKISKKILKKIPDIKKFTFSSFSEFHGWGNHFNIDEIKK